MHASHIRPSARSTSAMIASCDPDATASAIRALLPPLPALAAVAAHRVSATAVSLVMVFIEVLLSAVGSVRAVVRVVRAGVVVHTHVSREDELVELRRGEL